MRDRSESAENPFFLSIWMVCWRRETTAPQRQGNPRSGGQLTPPPIRQVRAWVDGLEGSDS